VPDANHFTAIAPLAEPNSPMVLRLKELAPRLKTAGTGRFRSCGKLF
jgi:hypothetical protein